jgi:hypothetical protein
MSYSNESGAGAWDSMTNTRLLLEGILVHAMTFATLFSVGMVSLYVWSLF